jgi:hypothetical protein
MDVKIDFMETSTPLEFPEALNTYTKGPMFCVYADGRVHKFPVAHIFRVVETYTSANR